MKSYTDIKEYVQKTADINGAAALLSWDKEVNLPAGGAAIRSRQMATLTSLSHERTIHPQLIENIERLIQENNLSEDERMNLMRLQEDVTKQTKFSAEFVEKMSVAVSAGYHAWLEARKKSDFSIYQDNLHHLIELKKESAEILGYDLHAYDALIDEYEPGMTVDVLDRVFTQVKEELVPTLHEYAARAQPDDQFLQEYYKESDQWDFGLQVLTRMGYNFNCGRQDKSPHPFTISFAPSDVRITTRVDLHNYAYMLWSTIHEGGHALYEQGLPESEYGMPLGQAASLAVHESQSRLWENHVGRSMEFWQYYYPELQHKFPRQLKDISVEQFYKATNKIAPNLIRTEADELHYHLHVLIRYEIEKLMITDEVSTKDLPAVWNELYAKYLNMKVPNDAEGVLQDVHWAFGSIGYFPTYSLGSFYAAQFYAKAQESIKYFDKNISSGQFNPLLKWLRENVHQHGRRYESEALCKKITGEPLDLKYFMDYVTNKFGAM
jgi:carboxypeptidase Taq